MDPISREELATLVAHQDGPHVSIFLPTVRAGQETLQNPIRFKNLLREATGRLQEQGLDRAAADALLEPARGLVDDYDFWQHQEDGLAVFVARDFLRTYRLPLRFHELAAVEDRFHLKSLLPLFNLEGRFYVLALAINSVRLLEGSRYAVREVPLPGVPGSLAEALGRDLTEQHLQFHTGTRAVGAARSPVYHGQGGGEEDSKDEIRRYFGVVDKGVREVIGDGAPLVLAGVEYLQPIYRAVSGHPQVLAEGVDGNPEALSAADLHARAWALVEERFRGERRDAAARYGDLSGTGLATGELDQVVTAAMDGRVDTLFVARGVREWGAFDAERREVERHDEQQADSEDLLDRAAVHTWLNGGAVYAVDPAEVPGESCSAAIFRY